MNFLYSNRLGIVCGAETGFKLASNPDTVCALGVSFVRRERYEAIGPTTKYWPEAPILAVEVLSLDDRVFEVDEKTEEWLAACSELVWIVNLRTGTVAIHQCGQACVVVREDDVLDGGEVCPGLASDIHKLFDL